MNLELFFPELILAITAILVILLDLFIRRKGLLAVISLIGIVVSAGFAIALWGGSPQSIFNNMLAVDNFAIFFKLLFLGITALVILASTDYVAKVSRFQGEYYALILLSMLGMMLM
ncbi:MAG: NADH-quinone oxidoreductase subunit N, partial [Chloroflexi bacterium]|nr:NADH-quinone oxidoreductase subunit N [Chloroflexota bacterium]